jgi:hypothetical protein
MRCALEVSQIGASGVPVHGILPSKRGSNDTHLVAAVSEPDVIACRSCALSRSMRLKRATAGAVRR